MNSVQTIRDAFNLPTYIVERYLEDLSDEDLLVRPLPDMNHIAWQLGHLIFSEYWHLDQAFPGRLTSLDASFIKNHSRENVKSDRTEDFLTKAEYLSLMRSQRQETFKILETLDETSLAKPTPDSLSYFGPTIASVFLGEITHWMMHAGQWAVIRRKLGKPPLF